MSVAILCLSLALGADPAPYPNAKMLIEPAQLAQKEVAEKSVIIDVRGDKSYTEGHVPGAIQVDVGALSKAVNTDSDPEKWGSRLEWLGIAPTSHVIIYGDDWREAARLWWIFRYLSVQDVRLLNGGWTAWTASGGKVSTVAAKPRPLMLGIVKPVADRIATKDDVLAMITNRRRSSTLGRRASSAAPRARPRKKAPSPVRSTWSGKYLSLRRLRN